MLRLIFVFGIILAGAYYSVQSAFYALLFYLWNAYFRPESWVWGNVIWSLRLSLIIGGFLLAASIPSFSRFRLNRQLLLVLLFFCQSIVSLLASSHFDLILNSWVEFLKVVLITAIMTILIDDERKYRLTLLVIALSLGFEAAKQGWAQLVTNPGAMNANEHLVLGDNNGVALGMMMLIPVFLALAQTATARWERYTYLFFIVGVFYRSVSTYSRGGFIAAGVVCLISLWRSKHKIRTLAVVAILGGSVSTVMPQSFWDRMETITAPADSRDVSALGRLYHWGLARQMAAEHPLTGVGLNGFRYEFDAYDRMSGGVGGWRAVHSVWFGLVSELGYPGLVIFILLLLGSIWSCHRIARHARATGRHNIVIYAGHLQTSLLVFAVGGTFLNAQYVELAWHFIGLTIALERIADAPPLPVLAVATAATRRPVTTAPRFLSAPARRQQ